MILESFWLILLVVPWIQSTWAPSYVANWQIHDPNNRNETCALLTGDFVFTIPYLLRDGEIGVADVEIPKSGTANGTCEKWQQDISLTWPTPGANASTLNVVDFTFNQNGSAEHKEHDGYFKLTRIKATIHTNPIQFPAAVIPAGRVFTFTGNFLALWTAPLQLSYYCESEQELPLDMAGGFLRMSHVQVQPFHETPVGGEPSEFSLRSYCTADAQSMMIHGLLFISLLFLVSIIIAFTFRQKRRYSYRPL